MSRKALISVFQGESIAISGADGETPTGDLHMAVRRALHSAKARAGGELDRPGHGEACLSKPSDAPLAVGIIACALLADGFVVQLVAGTSVAFDEPQ